MIVLKTKVEAAVPFMTQHWKSHDIPSAVLCWLKQTQAYLNSREGAQNKGPYVIVGERVFSALLNFWLLLWVSKRCWDSSWNCPCPCFYFTLSSYPLP